MTKPTTLSELFDALRKVCDDYRLEWTQSSEEAAIIDGITDYTEQVEDEAEASGLLA